MTAEVSEEAAAVQLRIGDSERQQAAQELSRHCAAGRLTVDEFDERVCRAWSAKTAGDLRVLAHDLPATVDQSAPPTTWKSWIDDGRTLLNAVPARYVVMAAAAGLALLFFAFLMVGHADFEHYHGGH